MLLMLLSLAVPLFCGSLAALTCRRSGFSAGVGVAGAVVGSGFGFVAGVRGLFIGDSASVQLPWAVPGGSFHLEADPLSSFFLIPITLLGGLCAFYGAAYLKGGKNATGAALSWFHYNLLLASMITVVLSRNAILFLAAWETMALASFFLVTFENGRLNVRTAGWVYLVACHLG